MARLLLLNETGMKTNTKFILTLIAVIIIAAVAVGPRIFSGLKLKSSVSQMSQCQDGIDNDGDGRIDAMNMMDPSTFFNADPGCSIDLSDNDETDETFGAIGTGYCGNGIVEAPAEECDGIEGCDTTCHWQGDPDNSVADGAALPSNDSAPQSFSPSGKKNTQKKQFNASACKGVYTVNFSHYAADATPMYKEVCSDCSTIHPDFFWDSALNSCNNRNGCIGTLPQQYVRHVQDNTQLTKDYYAEMTAIGDRTNKKLIAAGETWRQALHEINARGSKLLLDLSKARLATPRNQDGINRLEDELSQLAKMRLNLELGGVSEQYLRINEDAAKEHRLNDSNYTQQTRTLMEANAAVIAKCQ